jgi:benzoate transport
MDTDPREVIADSPMTSLQIIAVAITVGLNALDGFDVLAISFASPGIAQEWGITRAALGIVLSMELLGMSIGSILLGGLADRIGRRPTILGCLGVMAFGMVMTTTVKGIVDLSFWRVVTGLGIGGMLAAINAVAAEFSNAKRRHFSVSLMAIGYPIGAVIGGLAVGRLLQLGDWRPVFGFGAIMTALFIPLVFFVLPESVQWLARKQPDHALAKINRTLQRMGHPSISALPSIAPEARKLATRDLFSPALVASTVFVTLAYFFHITTFYFILKWVPKIVTDLGFAPAMASSVLVWANVGGATGGALLGLLTLRFNVKLLTIAVLVLSAVMVTVFGNSAPDLGRLSLICAIAGLCTNAGVVGMYAIFAQAFPTHARASGTGFAIGVGRGGSVLAPIIAGFLFTFGFSLLTVAFLMGLGSLLAATMLLLLKLKPEQVASA